MQLELTEELVKSIKTVAKSTVIQDWRSWGSLNVEHQYLHIDDLMLIRGKLEGRTKLDKPGRVLLRKLRNLASLKHVGKTKDLETLAELIRDCFRKTLHRWFFVEDKTCGYFSPYLVVDVDYHPARGHGDSYQPAYTHVAGVAMIRGERISKSMLFSRGDLGSEGLTADEALSQSGFLVETDELFAEYQEHCQKYDSFRKKTGIQLIATGWASAVKDRWERTKIRLDHNDTPGRLVVDDDEDWDDDTNVMTLSSDFTENDPDSEEDRPVVEIPAHPYVRCFHLRLHTFLTTHVANVEKYIYDRKIFERLVIPEANKQIIDVLVKGGRAGDDLIAGKGRGIIILLSGKAGTGKTLTSEGYAEWAHKPLYTVQCSQLGISAESLEKELGIVLNRASKWEAILLIDEADVYIRERGDDLNQNAVVGVFLRLLEYYTGVLFMTTNRTQLVDDAILSRCLIHVRYQVPDQKAARQIWEVMFNQYGLKPLHREKLLDELLVQFPTISGRSIKQLCRLASTMVEQTKKPADLAMFKWMGSYQDLEQL